MNGLISVLFCCLLFAPFRVEAQTATTDQLNDDKATTHKEEPEKNQRFEMGMQYTVLPQTLLPFHSPYEGFRSLPSYLGTRTTHSATLYLGARISPSLDVYVDPEWILGAGLGPTSGLAGFPNVEVVRIGVKEVPYFARAFVRGTVSTGRGMTSVDAGENQIPGNRPAHALILTAGKLAATDIFDKNAYANSGRTQFMNWALVNNAAYDYDADVRGYTAGAALEWVHPAWTLRFGSFLMPIKANGPKLAGTVRFDRGDQIELEGHVGKSAVVRVLGYRNIAHMGKYSDALALAAKTGTVPDIIAVEKRGAIKYGGGLSFDQALGEDGDTGVFARLGWNDGATETFAYTECDSSISLGLQVSGKRWRSPKDHLGIALCEDGLSAPHRHYLAAGGVGFQVGDGKLNYGHERVFETYYTRQFTPLLQGSADFQLIQNPGYNQDRGPVPIVSFRLHLEF